MLNNIYNQQITILNKLKAADSLENKDVWQKTIIDNAAWYRRTDRTVTSSGVAIGSFVSCLIPYTDKYVDYQDWAKLEDRSNNFTISSGDYIIKGDVPQEITAQNVVSVIKEYGTSACTVKQFQELHNRFGATVQLSVEGV